jgi:hypothetical protein
MGAFPPLPDSGKGGDPTNARERSQSVAENGAGLARRVHLLRKTRTGVQPASFWHDVPLQAPRSGRLNFVCEIPRGYASSTHLRCVACRAGPPRRGARSTTAKMEIVKEEHGNPIFQDRRGSVLRQPTPQLGAWPRSLT